MRVDAFHYELPPELIAQWPAEDREVARLMFLPPVHGAPEHRRVRDLPDLVPRGALVVVNDTRVIPARLMGRKRGTGGRVELLLVRRVGSRDIDVEPGQTRRAEIWRALGKATKPLRFESDIAILPRRGDAHGVEGGAAPALFARLLGRSEDDRLLEVALWTASGGPVDAAVRALGHVPLPPYIKREDAPADLERYQTIYARHDGAVAAPTAGLHLTKSLFARLAERGCEIATVTLHVGLGTFQPVAVEDLDLHPMHAERCTIDQAAVDAVDRARGRGAPVLAVGTTTARALESAADPSSSGRIRAGDGETRLLIQPGHAWKVVNGLFTNFHLPCSTLLAMVCALTGTERVLEAYRLAVREQYRFFSYGDAMLLSRSA
jgi:S-adenosylmethionine:tRNA ribosyltransferase-isomerase